MNGSDGGLPASICGVCAFAVHMTKGQRAMVGARVQCILNIQSTRAAAKLTEVSHSHVGHALIVLEYAPDLVDAVMQGKNPLNEA